MNNQVLIRCLLTVVIHWVAVFGAGYARAVQPTINKSLADVSMMDDFQVYSLSKDSIHNLFLNPKENALLAEVATKGAVMIYQDTTSVLQIMEVSPDNRWAVLVAMPIKVDGRAETRYLLVDIGNRKVVNRELMENKENYHPSLPMYLEPAESGELYLLFFDADGTENRWLLK